MTLRSLLVWTVLSVLSASLWGCSDNANSKSGTPTTPVVRAKSSGGADPVPAKTGATSGSHKTATPASVGGNVVTLGSDELTAGLSGQGALTIEQLKTWLENPANHEPLQAKLPLGLDAGQSAIQGLADNPLTRAKIELGRQLYFDKRLS